MIVGSKSRPVHVRFIDYTGRYPSLCMGVLVLEINGQRYYFGNDFDGKYKDKKLLSQFWTSGGSCGFRNNYSDSYVEQDDWRIDTDDLPAEFLDYAEEIDEVFNENVPYGCCGGCL